MYTVEQIRDEIKNDNASLEDFKEILDYMCEYDSNELLLKSIFSPEKFVFIHKLAILGVASIVKELE